MFFGELPEEIREHIERNKMEMQDAAHKIRDFFAGLNEDQLVQLKAVLSAVDSRPEYNFYYIGIITSALSTRFGYCLGCGEKHDEQLEAILPNDPERTSPAQRSRHLLLDQYFVNDSDDPSTKGTVACQGCGRSYISLEDRMLAKPGKAGCPTCVQKEKWG